MHRTRYAVKTSSDPRPGGGVTVSLNVQLSAGGTGHGELLRHFHASMGEAARDYERRLGMIADILNPSREWEALKAAESALDIAQASVDSPRERKRMLTALEVVRLALRAS